MPGHSPRPLAPATRPGAGAYLVSVSRLFGLEIGEMTQQYIKLRRSTSESYLKVNQHINFNFAPENQFFFKFNWNFFLDI